MFLSDNSFYKVSVKDIFTRYYHVSVNTKRVGLVDVKLFPYFSYNSRNLWMVGDITLMFHSENKKNMLLVKSIQSAITCSNLPIETIEQSVKYVQS